MGIGTGNGSGFGNGNGNRRGNGDGDGNGNGNGAGVTAGSGYGGSHCVLILGPDTYAIGCQRHHIGYWREHWHEIAAHHNVDLQEAEELMRVMEAYHLAVETKHE